jgi:hypothetical protein
VLTAAAVTTLRGQASRVYLTPYGGAFIPTSTLGSVAVLDNNDNPITIDGKLQTSPGLGGRLAYWSSERFGIEASYFYDKGSLKVTDGRTSALFDSEIQIGSLKAMLQVSNGASGTDFVVNGGLAGVHHGGPAFLVGGTPTAVGGIVGTGLYIDVGSQVRLRLDSEMFVYDWRGQGGFPSKLQADLMFTGGLAIRLSR